MSIGVKAKLALMAFAFVLMAPVQLLLVRAGLRQAGWLPVLFHRLFLRLFGIRVATTGRPPNGPTLVLANHVSWLDISVIGSLAPLSFIAKSEVSSWPVVRTFARLQRTIFVDRSLKSATGEVAARVAARLAVGDIIVLFAEGTTSDGSRVLPFRSALIGATRQARGDGEIAAVTLQPLAITYTRRNGLPLVRRDWPAIAWYGDMELEPHLAALLGAGPVDAVLHWCEPIPAETASDRKRAAVLARQAVRRALESIRAGQNANAIGLRDHGLFSRRRKTLKETTSAARCAAMAGS